MRFCQCEHVSHVERGVLSPNGNPGHKYGSRFLESYLYAIKTDYGTFHVCKDCKEDCHQQERSK